MRANRYVANEPRATIAEPISEPLPKFSATCEVAGCRSLYVGKDSSGRDRFACGKADVLVLDHRGNRRGICALHYTRQLVRDGKAANQDLVDADGRYDIAKVKHYRDTHAQADIPLKTAAPIVPAGPQPFHVPPVVQQAIDRGYDDGISDDEFFASHERDRGFA